MPPRISKDRENLVAAAGSCLIQVRSMVTEQCIQTNALRHGVRALPPLLPTCYLMSCCGGVSREYVGKPT